MPTKLTKNLKLRAQNALFQTAHTTEYKTMKIALIHEYLTNFAGSEQVLLALHELYPEAPIYTAFYNRKTCPQFQGADIRTSFLQRFPWQLEKLYIPLLPLAVEGYDLSEFDLVISDSHIAAKGVITKPETIHICYCHTPIRYAWSPEVDNRASKNFLARLASHYLRLWDSYAVKRVDYWLANSNYVARRIRKYYHSPSTVIYPPVTIQPTQKNEKPQDYFVLFGRLIAYKKADIVIKAFNKLGKRLKVIGRGPELQRLKKLAKSNVEFISDYLPYSELQEIFCRSSAMIFPAEEDFGIVMVEQMAAGRPVIAYRAGGALDIVVAGKTGEFFNEQSIEAIVAAVAEFKPLSYDTKVIRAHASTFNPTVFKRKILAFVKEKLEKR